MPNSTQQMKTKLLIRPFHNKLTGKIHLVKMQDVFNELAVVPLATKCGHKLSDARAWYGDDEITCKKCGR